VDQKNRKSTENFGIKIIYKQSKFFQRIETTQRMKDLFIRWVVSIRWLEFGGFQAIVSSRLGEFVFVDPSGMKHFVVFPLFFDV
jgi:hypothetical protein